MNAGTRAINAMMWRHIATVLAIIVVALALAGCQTTRYVRTPCLTTDQLEQQRQAEPPKVRDKLNGKADEDIRTIAGSNVRLRAWGSGMLGILSGCVG